MSEHIGPKTIVECTRFAGHPTISAECCVSRSLVPGRGSRRERPLYPVCAACPLGRLRRMKLEAGGWTFDLKAARDRQAVRLRSEARARRKILAARMAG